jgi:dTDP-glucose 4,6-dehydratase
MILVTGAAGLVGRELIGQLAAAKHAVRGVDLLSSEPPVGADGFLGDLLDASFCQRACDGIKTVIHAAARQYHSNVPSWGRRRFFDANVRMTRNLVEAAVSAGASHVVFISSDMVYGLPAGKPLTEEDRPRPIGPYGASKLASEEICLAARRRGLRVTIFRPRLIIGPGRLGVLKKLFDRIRAGHSVPMLGDGGNRYQMVAVSDVIAACRLAIQNPVDAVLNLGSAHPPTVRFLLASLCKRADSPSILKPLPRRVARAGLWSLHALRMGPLSPEQFRIADVDYLLDTSRAAEVLGWHPQFSDADMLWSAYETYVTPLSQRRVVGGPNARARLAPRPTS